MSALQNNKPLKPYNTFGIAVNAKYFVEIFSEQELIDLYKSDIPKDPLLVIGGGSNILFTKDFEGLVIKMSIPGINATITGTDVIVTAGAGVVWNDLVNYCVANNYAGIENLSLIPGTVGAAPIQNIGAYGVEIKDVFESCRALEIYSNKIVEFMPSACKFGYRDSIFKSVLKGKYIITAVSFKLSTKASINTKYGAIADELEKRRIFYPGIADVSKVVSEIRVSKLPDPSTIGNAGSFFKNPVISKAEFEPIHKNFPDMVNYPAPDGKVKLAAGWLIEQCGFKGMVSGQTGTWKNQALVLVNHGQATGQEVYSFSEQVINAVNAKFNVQLEREVNIL
ncbi:MAG: UDP-N-acetylmuramate dehydrogenase [Bacteroidota bacterium]